jgi:hypothetical protein
LCFAIAFNLTNNFISDANVSFSLTELFHEIGIRLVIIEAEKQLNGVYYSIVFISMSG